MAKKVSQATKPKAVKKNVKNGKSNGATPKINGNSHKKVSKKQKNGTPSTNSTSTTKDWLEKKQLNQELSSADKQHLQEAIDLAV